MISLKFFFNYWIEIELWKKIFIDPRRRWEDLHTTEKHCRNISLTIRIIFVARPTTCLLLLQGKKPFGWMMKSDSIFLQPFVRFGGSLLPGSPPSLEEIQKWYDHNSFEVERNDKIAQRNNQNDHPKWKGQINQADEISHPLGRNESDVHITDGHKDQINKEDTIRMNWTAEWLGNAECDTNRDILMEWRKEYRRTFHGKLIDHIRPTKQAVVPRVLRENVINEDLEEQLDGALSKNRQENSLAYESSSWRLTRQTASGMCPTHRKGNGENNEEIDVEILEVAQHGVDVITNHNGYELNNGVKGHEFETLEGGHQRTSPCGIEKIDTIFLKSHSSSLYSSKNEIPFSFSYSHYFLPFRQSDSYLLEGG
jgi:hypothetical protein